MNHNVTQYISTQYAITKWWVLNEISFVLERMYIKHLVAGQWVTVGHKTDIIIYLIKHACVQVSFLCLLITLIKLILRSSLFWDVTQCRLVVSSPTFRDNLSVPPLSIRQSLLLDPWRCNSFTQGRKTEIAHKLMSSNIQCADPSGRAV